VPDGSKVNISTEISGSRIIQNVDKFMLSNRLQICGIGKKIKCEKKEEKSICNNGKGIKRGEKGIEKYI
jgi:hypothetical protein